MPLFAIVCRDRPGALDLRLATRPTHLDYLQARAPMLRLAGPCLDDAGQPCGSLLVVEAEDRAAAEAFAREDPYSKAGLFAEVTITAFAKTLGSWS